MASSVSSTLFHAAAELAVKHTRKYPVTVGVVAGCLLASTALASWLGWTVGTVLVITLLSYPAKRLVATEVWLHSHRRLLASASLRWPGRREALAFRKRENQRMKLVRKQFDAVCAVNGLHNAAKQTPALRKLRSTADGSLQAHISPGPMAIKGGVKAFMAKRDEIAELCGAEGGLRIKPYGSQTNATMPGKAQLTFYFEKRTWPPLPIQALPDSPADRATIGNDQDLNAAHLPFCMAILLVAQTGMGKSQTIWALLVSISRKAASLLYVIDPKGGQELGALKGIKGQQIGNRKVVDYGDNSDVEAYRVIMAAEKAMKDRQKALAEAGIRKWNVVQHAEQFPVIVLVIDEVLEFFGKINAANKPGKAAEAALITLLSQGRAAGVWTIMASQASDKEILGTNRTLIPTRIVMGTDNPIQTGMAFGDAAAEVNGAACSQITEPGIAFLKIDSTEGHRGYKQVRIAFVEDDDIETFVREGAPANMGTTGTEKSEAWKPCWNYRYLVRERCVIDGIYYFPGQLLYVGISTSPGLRHKQHLADYDNGDAKHKWVEFIDRNARPIITYAASRDEAKRIESSEIKSYNPTGNLMENDLPETWRLPVGVPVEQLRRSAADRLHVAHGPRKLRVRPAAAEPELAALEAAPRELAQVWSG